MAKRRVVDFFGLGAFKKNALGYEVFSKDHITAWLSGGGKVWTCQLEMEFPLKSRVRGLKLSPRKDRRVYTTTATGTTRQRAVNNLATPALVGKIHKLTSEWMLEFDRLMTKAERTWR